MGKLIKKLFKEYLNIEVIVFSSKEFEYAIYVKKNGNLKKNDYLEYCPDYAIYSIQNNHHFESGKWISAIHGKYGGSYYEPPYSDLFESNKTFYNINGALRDLIYSLVKQRIDDYILSHEMEEQSKKIDFETK